jgi:dolichyl-phosphate beta-glucosyltransferase
MLAEGNERDRRDDRSGPYLSIVIPAYNEERRIRPSLKAILEHARSAPYRTEILVVDDGSTDRTIEVSRAALAGVPGARVVENGRNRGKGYSVRHGAVEATGEVMLLTDADLSTPIEEVDSLLRHLGEIGHGIVIGSRAVTDSHVEIHQNPVRELMGKTFNRIVRALTGLPFNDTQCGFKLMTVRDTLPIFRKALIDGFSWDVELLYVAARRGVPVKEVGVTWRNAAGSKVGVLTEPWRMFRDIFKIRSAYGRGHYDA